MDGLDDEGQSLPQPRPPVIRGARACRTCRAAKMKCVGAEDGLKQCQRCKRSNVECVFEKHRRGRKPGSKLSEASKMLRKLEKGLNSQKQKSQSAHSAAASAPALSLYPPTHTTSQEYTPDGTHFPTNQLPPLSFPPSSSANPSMDIDDDDDDDPDREGPFPANVILKENKRNSFFTTILNPEDSPTLPAPHKPDSFSPPSLPLPIPQSPVLSDPVASRLLSEEQAKVLLEIFFLRFNPFVNLFDPALHDVPYLRSRCPFLFTTILMAVSKFFRQELYKPLQKLAKDFAVLAFSEGWRRVEVVQAFACMTYWKEHGDNDFTWTYIGYACRMAVDLGLNRYHPQPPPNESEQQLRERRNRERTYLSLFIYDRSLATQTGKHWMLPEDEFIRHSITWHEHGGSSIRPEDVIMSAFVQLRHIAAETTDILRKGSGNHQPEFNIEVILRNCNSKLQQWMEHWEVEMSKANGDKFHVSFLRFWMLYIRLFLNSFGIHDLLTVPTPFSSPSALALTACYHSALDSLKIISGDFTDMGMLRYSQDVVTVMSAYSAVVLLRLLRNETMLLRLPGEAALEVHQLISQTADAYQEASTISGHVSTSMSNHARFLRALVENDIFKPRKPNERDRYDAPVPPIDPRLQGPASATYPAYPQNSTTPPINGSFQLPTPPHQPLTHPRELDYSTDPSRAQSQGYPMYPNGFGPPQHVSDADAEYWKSMLMGMGFGSQFEQMGQMHPLGAYPPHQYVAQSGY